MASLPSSTVLRLAGYYSFAFTAVILLLGAALYYAIRGELRYELDQRIVTERGAVLREAAAGGLAAVVAGRARHGSGDMRYALFNAAGRRIAGQPIGGAPVPGWSRMAFLEPSGAPDDTRGLASAVTGGGLLVVGADPEALEELDERMLPILLAAFGLILAVGVGGAVVLGRALSRRLDAINRTAEAIIGGDLARRMPVGPARDEFDRLSATLNRMLDRIGELLANLGQVSGDIAHDLRTPLSRVRQKLELALASTGGEEPLRAGIADALERSDEALELFSAMLAIAELEGGGVRRRPLDLGALVGELVESYRPSAEDVGRELVACIAADVVVQGNRELLAQLLGNLLDNALRHTPDGAAIEVSLGVAAGTAELAVADRGPGIPLADRDRVFGRFVRLDDSRTTPGHGLGLSLVAAVARAHDGSVRVEDHHPGASIIVTFPRSAA